MRVCSKHQFLKIFQSLFIVQLIILQESINLKTQKLNFMFMINHLMAINPKKGQLMKKLLILLL